MDELKKYTETFAAYDRDGGGEVDSLELGVMFRKLGHAVPDEAVFAMLDSVDIDESGTMSLEEFCLLMLRYKRGAAMPACISALTDYCCSAQAWDATGALHTCRGMSRRGVGSVCRGTYQCGGHASSMADSVWHVANKE